MARHRLSGIEIDCRFALSLALTVILATRQAHAGSGIGAEIGLVKRYDQKRSNPSLGYGLQLHGHFDVIPTVRLGPYYMLSKLSSHEVVGITINSFGARATFMVPVSGDVRPYLYAGAGYSWISYSYGGFIECVPGVQCAPPEGSGAYLELPLGVGVAYSVSPLFQLSLDAAYRPGFGFSGKVFDGGDARPTHGWSLLFGAAYHL
jgi:opacity protein-like surface antigen